MDLYKNVAQTQDEVLADASMKDAGTMTGGTPNVMPGYSIADESKEAISQGSAKDSMLDMDKFAHMPIKGLTM